eukprot:CAMPEP_0180523630 /NCGR_PEP_ID=MMETSP1036_2-20121128/58150_1 /TAXON_ID=632150 /ORGANISM="Azadinium spinosum, Strain 3D9" /LENGTH=48 /DNA_ID= /DNA_START= /DNA_END= /DNA_ORIENTATION=
MSLHNWYTSEELQDHVAYDAVFQPLEIAFALQECYFPWAHEAHKHEQP